MSRPFQQVFGLTAAQLDKLQAPPPREPDGGKPTGAYNLRVVEVIDSIPVVDSTGQRHVWRGRLVELVNGQPTRGDRVWIRNQVPQMKVGGTSTDGVEASYLTGNHLRCRTYAAVYTEAAETANGEPDPITGDMAEFTAPVYSVISAQSQRMAMLTDFATIGDPTLNTIHEFSWTEMIIDAVEGATQAGFMSGSCRARAGLSGMVASFSPSCQGGTYTGTWNGTPLGTLSLFGLGGAGQLQTAIAALTSGAVVNQTTLPGGGFTWTVVASGSNTLTLDLSGITPTTPRYPAYNLVPMTATQAQALTGTLVPIWEGCGGYPSVTIKQTAYGRAVTETVAVSEVSFESIREGKLCLTMWNTGEGEAVDVVFAYNAGPSTLEDALNAAASGEDWGVTFTVTGLVQPGGSCTVTAVGTYDDYGFTWNQTKVGADSWGTLEFAFIQAAPQTQPPFIVLARDGTLINPAPPLGTDGGPNDIFLATRDVNGNLMCCQITPNVDDANMVLMRVATTGTDDSTSDRFVWYEGLTVGVEVKLPDDTTAVLQFVGGLYTGAF